MLIWSVGKAHEMKNMQLRGFQIQSQQNCTPKFLNQFGTHPHPFTHPKKRIKEKDEEKKLAIIILAQTCLCMVRSSKLLSQRVPWVLSMCVFVCLFVLKQTIIGPKILWRKIDILVSVFVLVSFVAETQSSVGNQLLAKILLLFNNLMNGN